MPLRAAVQKSGVVPGIDWRPRSHRRNPAAISEMMLLRRIARLRVPLACLSVAFVLWLAHPTGRTLTIGAIVAAAGEALRVWAAGQLEKGREVTASGPYALTRHPLYAGSIIIGIGLAIACGSIVVAVLV